MPGLLNRWLRPHTVPKSDTLTVKNVELKISKICLSNLLCNLLLRLRLIIQVVSNAITRFVIARFVMLCAQIFLWGPYTSPYIYTLFIPLILVSGRSQLAYLAIVYGYHGNHSGRPVFTLNSVNGSCKSIQKICRHNPVIITQIK